MDLGGSSLIVVADGRHARLFEERLRGGPLIEITDTLGDLAPHRPMASGFRGRVHDRFGAASHTVEDTAPKTRLEDDFIRSVGARAAEIMRSGGYDDLILIAPPRALGRLRQAIDHAGVAVTLSEPHDRVSATAEALKACLRTIRREA